MESCTQSSADTAKAHVKQNKKQFFGLSAEFADLTWLKSFAAKKQPTFPKSVSTAHIDSRTIFVLSSFHKNYFLTVEEVETVFNYN